MGSKPSTQFLIQLRQGLVASFNSDELETLCSDIGVDYENLEGSAKEAKARELIAYLSRRGQLQTLLDYCVQHRPEYAWPKASGPTNP